MDSELAHLLPATYSWAPLVCPRIGAAPLRFHGRVLHKLEVWTGETRLFVHLHQRKAGNLTVALSRLTDCGVWADHAFTVETIPAAMQALEAYCIDIADELDCASQSQPDGIDGMLRDLLCRGRLASEVRLFQELAGAALDAWDNLSIGHQIGTGKKR